MKSFIRVIVGVAVLTMTAAADDQVMLQFPNTDVNAVLDFYEHLTGFHIVRDNQVIGQVSVVTPQRVAKEKAVELIEQTLFSNGFSIIQSSKDTVRIVGIGKNPVSEGIPFVSKVEDIPAGERLISFAIKLQFRQPGELIRVLREAQPPSPNGTGLLMPDAASRSIIVTDRTSVVRRLIGLVKEIDVRKAK